MCCEGRRNQRSFYHQVSLLPDNKHQVSIGFGSMYYILLIRSILRHTFRSKIEMHCRIDVCYSLVGCNLSYILVWKIVSMSYNL